MLRIGVFVDISNLYFTTKKKFSGGKIDYNKFLVSAVGKNELVCAYAYGAQEGGQAANFIKCLVNFGFIPKFKEPRQVAPNVKKADWDVGITIDVIKHLSKLDIVVLGSSDGDFAPLVKFVQNQGVRVHVWGALISRELKNIADKYHEIGESFVHAGTTEEPESSELPPNEPSDLVEDSGGDDSEDTES